MSTDADITAFIRARLDEDEREARAGFSGQADTENGWGEVGTAVTPHVGVIHEDIQRAHVVKWNPARVLHGVEVKRRMLAYCEWVIETRVLQDAANQTTEWTQARDSAGQHLLKLLAIEWSDNADYRPEWTL